MCVDPEGLCAGGPGDERLNVFALVIYIPAPLGEFLDEMRRELAPHSNPHAHVSVLPPRPLPAGWETAAGQLRAAAAGWAPFDVEMTAIDVFPVTDVVYIQVAGGAAELRRMHETANTGPLASAEPFAYYPHITVAQEIPPDRAAWVRETAAKLWAGYRGERRFRADCAVFVQNTAAGRWEDLASFPLRDGAGGRR